MKRKERERRKEEGESMKEEGTTGDLVIYSAQLPNQNTQTTNLKTL